MAHTVFRLDSSGLYKEHILTKKKAQFAGNYPPEGKYFSKQALEDT